MNQIIVIRTPSGISGDMLLTGFIKLLGISRKSFNDLIEELGFDSGRILVEISPKSVSGISGWFSKIELKNEHIHRNLADIKNIVAASNLTEDAKILSVTTFEILAEAESKVHNVPPGEITFHEVGALDSILDICLSSTLYCMLKSLPIFCSPLPISDGTINCHHGLMASPAPAVQEMLLNIPIYGVQPEGETVTPTALAFLKAVKTKFGPWPTGKIEQSYRVYGTKLFRNMPNGAIFSIMNTPLR